MDTYKDIKILGDEKLVILVRNKMTGEVFEIPTDTSSIGCSKNISSTANDKKDH
ncbi:hypothetical protein [Cysteiniphilum halobium]|uniref:hypothetical protein n=1 Tax=Cysteiniphilum halobium TaxID=2219059 RepID=UPI0013C37955|nr:hypothetical protein [Cysteiniphilum halobium]